MRIRNLTGYHFFEVVSPEVLKEQLFAKLEGLDLMGTIILANEGINFSLSIAELDVGSFYKILFADLALPQFEVKSSFSSQHPHKRFLVKIRPEICTIGCEGLDLTKTPSQYVEPKELKAWLDNKEDIVLLDTRKAFEFEMGSFEGAINLGGKHFRDFPTEVEDLKKDYQHKKIVSFCTGGIRCEKGAPLMVAMGFTNVFQLKGGILKYFEECGGAHWRGDCFVFDHRAAVDPDLQPVKSVRCQSCSESYNPQEVSDIVDGLRLMCPSCFTEWRALKDKGLHRASA